MRVLVTGASGLLGATVVARLFERGDEVTTLQRRASGIDGVRDVRGSLTDQGAVDDAVRGADAVVHCAAKVGFTGSEAEFARVNAAGTAALVSAARSAGARAFVQVSSPSVAHTGSSIVGEGAGPASPEHARGAYARTKAAGEVAALEADGPGFTTVAVRPHLMWGPGDTQLVERVAERTRTGRMPLVGDGAPLVDSTYTDDAVTAVVAALDRALEADLAVAGRAFVVTSGQPRPVGELISRIALAGGGQVPTRHVPFGVAWVAGALAEGVWAVLRVAGSSLADEEPPLTRFLAEQLGTAHWFDLRETRAALRWEPAVGIDEGLRRTATFYDGWAAPA